MTRHTALLAAATVFATTVLIDAQQRPRAEVMPVAASSPVKAGGTLRVSLGVRLPKDIHVQANKPRDPYLVATSLTLTPPEGITVQDVTYPAPSELEQKGKNETLLVLGPEFSIEVRLAVARNVSAGEVVIPAVLRYQACNDELCFPPTRATAQWTVKVE